MQGDRGLICSIVLVISSMPSRFSCSSSVNDNGVVSVQPYMIEYEIPKKFYSWAFV